MDATETIVGCATPWGQGGVGILRLSGPAALAIARRCFRRQGRLPADAPWEPRRAYAGRIVDPDSAAVLDQGLALYFPAPRSYTREAVVELHCHSNPLLLQRLLDLLVAQGARPARAGEFTYRAFLHGGVDLARAEAVHDLITARSARAVSEALAQQQGSVSALIADWRGRLVDWIARVEAAVEFPDESDVADHRTETAAGLAALRARIAAVTDRFAAADRLRQGWRVVIAGPPNAGKSSLYNRLLAQERAIVTAHPGTTRDPLREPLDLEGLPVILEDTAGLRESADPVEREGVARTRQALGNADLVLLLRAVDGAAGDAGEPLPPLKDGAAVVRVLNKIDLAPVGGAAAEHGEVPVSCQTGEGVDRLRARIGTVLAARDTGDRSPLIHNLRQQQAVRRAAETLAAAAEALAAETPEEYLITHGYEALKALEAVVGTTEADEIYERVFATFCIGK